MKIGDVDGWEALKELAVKEEVKRLDAAAKERVFKPRVILRKRGKHGQGRQVAAG